MRSPDRVSRVKGWLKTSKSSSDSETSTISSPSLIVGWDAVAFSSATHWNGSATLGMPSRIGSVVRVPSEIGSMVRTKRRHLFNEGEGPSFW